MYDGTAIEIIIIIVIIVIFLELVYDKINSDYNDNNSVISLEIAQGYKRDLKSINSRNLLNLFLYNILISLLII